MPHQHNRQHLGCQTSKASPAGSYWTQQAVSNHLFRWHPSPTPYLSAPAPLVCCPRRACTTAWVPATGRCQGVVPFTCGHSCSSWQQCRLISVWSFLLYSPPSPLRPPSPIFPSPLYAPAGPAPLHGLLPACRKTNMLVFDILYEGKETDILALGRYLHCMAVLSTLLPYLSHSPPPPPLALHVPAGPAPLHGLLPAGHRW
jgi:hypothetical protein